MKKGQTNNPNGRPKGTPNKITGDLRLKINAIVEKQIDNIEQDLQSLEPMQRLQIVEKLISYCVPKLQAQSFEIDLMKLSDEQLNQIINELNINDNDSNQWQYDSKQGNESIIPANNERRHTHTHTRSEERRVGKECRL